MPARLSADDLARFRRDYHQCGVTVMPLVAEVEASWADLAAARASRDRLAAACREAVLSLADPECDRGRVLRLLHGALEGEANP